MQRTGNKYKEEPEEPIEPKESVKQEEPGESGEPEKSEEQLGVARGTAGTTRIEISQGKSLVHASVLDGFYDLWLDRTRTVFCRRS